MHELHTLIESSRSMFFAVAFGWVFLGLLGSAAFRLYRGKPLFVKKFETPLFAENWTSGRDLDSWLTRLGGARNAIYVGIGNGQLLVQPHFPFSLLFLPETFGLEYRLPLELVNVLEIGKSPKNSIVITLGTSSIAANLELNLRDRESFLSALNANAARSAP
jgi:hypothetical protein